MPPPPPDTAATVRNETSGSGPVRTLAPGSTVPGPTVRPLHRTARRRVRLRVPGLYRSPRCKRRLEAILRQQDGIRTVEANPLTGNLLVVFDPRWTGDRIMRLVAALEVAKPARPTASPAGTAVTGKQPTANPAGHLAPRPLDARVLHFTALPSSFPASLPLLSLPAAFLRSFVPGLFHISPILLTLAAIIVLVGQVIGRKEGWSRSDALYFSFVTASTVGYGDLRPTQKSTKLLAAGIGFVGVLFTGMVTALGVHAAQDAFTRVHPGK